MPTGIAVSGNVAERREFDDVIVTGIGLDAEEVTRAPQIEASWRLSLLTIKLPATVAW